MKKFEFVRFFFSKMHTEIHARKFPHFPSFPPLCLRTNVREPIPISPPSHHPISEAQHLKKIGFHFDAHLLLVGTAFVLTHHIGEMAHPSVLPGRGCGAPCSVGPGEEVRPQPGVDLQVRPIVAKPFLRTDANQKCQFAAWFPPSMGWRIGKEDAFRKHPGK